jgi:hypothetical protein
LLPAVYGKNPLHEQAEEHALNEQKSTSEHALNEQKFTRKSAKKQTKIRYIPTVFCFAERILHLVHGFLFGLLALATYMFFLAHGDLQKTTGYMVCVTFVRSFSMEKQKYQKLYQCVVFQRELL